MMRYLKFDFSINSISIFSDRHKFWILEFFYAISGSWKTSFFISHFTRCMFRVMKNLNFVLTFYSILILTNKTPNFELSIDSRSNLDQTNLELDSLISRFTLYWFKKLKRNLNFEFSLYSMPFLNQKRSELSALILLI